MVLLLLFLQTAAINISLILCTYSFRPIVVTSAQSSMITNPLLFLPLNTL